MAVPCGQCTVQCADGRRFEDQDPYYESWDGVGGGGMEVFQCCQPLKSILCGKDVGSGDLMGLTVGGSTSPRPPLGGRRPLGGTGFRGADGKLYEGKTEIGGVDVPKVLVALGVAAAAFYIMKKMK